MPALPTGMPLRHVYLAFNRFRVAPAAMSSAIERLMEDSTLCVARTRVCYRERTDTTVIELRLRIESAWDLADIVVWAQGEGVKLIDPATLSAERRQQLKRSYATEFRCLPGTFVDPRIAVRALSRHLGLPSNANLARGTVNEPRPVAMAWQAPRLTVVDRTHTERGTRTASGVIGD